MKLENKTIAIFAISIAICIAMSVLGGFAYWDFFEKMNQESSIQGEIVSEDIIREKETIYDLDNATVFFNFDVPGNEWLQKDSTYCLEYKFAAMNYDSTTARYAIYINDIEGRGTNYFSSINATFDLEFKDALGVVVTVPLTVVALFNVDNSILQIKLPLEQADNVGYINKLIDIGMTIEIISNSALAYLPEIDNLPAVSYGMTFSEPTVNVVFDLTKCSGTMFLNSHAQALDSPYYISQDNINNYTGYNFLNMWDADKQLEFSMKNFIQDEDAGGWEDTSISLPKGNVTVLELNYDAFYSIVLISSDNHQMRILSGSFCTTEIEDCKITSSTLMNSYYLYLSKTGAENADSRMFGNTIYLTFDDNGGM